MEVVNKGDYYEVTLERTKHEVTISQNTYDELSNGRSKEQFIKDCFKFLLEREPEEAILRKFNVELIGRIFPEWKQEMKTRNFGKK